jgi:hypothetical protein
MNRLMFQAIQSNHGVLDFFASLNHRADLGGALRAGRAASSIHCT